jgi:hypothetical protein
MNDKQNAKLNMAQRVLDTLKRYETVYSDLAPMAAAVAALHTDIDYIRDAQKAYDSVNVPASTLEKRAAEAKMILPSIKMANALYLIGFATDNKDLLTLQGLSEHSFYRLSANAALALAGVILDLTPKNAAELQTASL